jgi:hypothetical protein
MTETAYEPDNPITMLMDAVAFLEDSLEYGRVADAVKAIDLMHTLLEIIHDDAMAKWEAEYAADLSPVTAKITARFELYDRLRKKGFRDE